MGAGVLVEVSEVSKAYKAAGKNEQILSGISLQVKEGEIISILGQSGCGKSTLLNLIAGFDTPDRGTIYTAGIEVKEPAKRCVMLFQNYGLLPWRSVLKNVELGLLDLTEAERRSRALAYLKLVGWRTGPITSRINCRGGCSKELHWRAHWRSGRKLF